MYANIEQLYKKYPWKTEKKFIPLAKKYGFKEKDAKEFLKRIVHDKRIKIKPVYLPIYSENGDSYQFDTFIQRKGPLKCYGQIRMLRTSQPEPWIFLGIKELDT